MLREAVYHVAHGSYAYPVSDDTLRVTLRAAKGDLQRVTVLYQDRYGGSEPCTADLEIAAEDELFTYYQGELQLATKRFGYVFLLDDGKNQVFYTEKGFFADVPPNTQFHYPYIAIGDLWEPPQWAQGAVVYQIFPERFANGDPSNDPPQCRALGRAAIGGQPKGRRSPGSHRSLRSPGGSGSGCNLLHPCFQSAQ